VHELTGQPITTLQTQWDADAGSYDCTFIGLRRDREDQSRRTNLRVHRMIEAGWVAEVEALLKETPPLSTAARQALGYAEIIQHLSGEMSLEEAVETIKINTRHFTKSQRTWFKRFADVCWIDVTLDADAENVAEQIASMKQMPWSS
jgi:tRNA dimethylallyltransferase